MAHIPVPIHRHVAAERESILVAYQFQHLEHAEGRLLELDRACLDVLKKICDDANHIRCRNLDRREREWKLPSQSGLVPFHHLADMSLVRSIDSYVRIDWFTMRYAPSLYP